MRRHTSRDQHRHGLAQLDPALQLIQQLLECSAQIRVGNECDFFYHVLIPENAFSIECRNRGTSTTSPSETTCGKERGCKLCFEK